MELLYEPENEIEAQALIGMLESEGIEIVVQRRADTAYPGIGDAASGWGRLLVRAPDLAKAQGLIADYLEAEGEPEAEFGDLVPGDSREGPYRTAARSDARPMEPKRILRNTAGFGGVLLLAGSLGLNAYYLLTSRDAERTSDGSGSRESSDGRASPGTLGGDDVYTPGRELRGAGEAAPCADR